MKLIMKLRNTAICGEKVVNFLLINIGPKIINFSDQHKNHYSGENKDTSHIKLIIVSKEFLNLSRIDRERKVHKVLKQEILDDIHSIRLKLHTEAEYSLIK